MEFEAWPEWDLEEVARCPYCGESECRLAYEGVKDWAFACAPGRWNYWNCDHCRALYLQPRPTAGSIGRAYARYYTHARGASGGLLGPLKQRVRNEYWSHSLQTTIEPRLGLPRWAAWVTGWLEGRIAEPFGLRQWVQLPKGLLIDVGCGNGEKLKLAAQLGWQALGIETDATAVNAARVQGLQVLQGGYELLANYQGQADCVVCSHVLEHVHRPTHLLRLLLESLTPQGVLLLSAPNASSHLRHHYGENWRGLEAPRHLAIPDAAWLVAWMRAQGFACSQIPSHELETAIESERIRRRGLAVLPADVHAAKKLLRNRVPATLGQQDVVQLVCTRAVA